MLIVIVIIWILAAALIPRLSNARGRANDTARKATLSQVAASLVSYQIDKWRFPSWCGPLATQTWLLVAWLDDIPRDPGGSTVVDNDRWVVNEDGSTIDLVWQYGYCAIEKNSQPDWWFVLMALAETEWWANYVICNGPNNISSSSDFATVQQQKCTKFTQWDWLCSQGTAGDWLCEYEAWKWQLRYIYLQ